MQQWEHLEVEIFGNHLTVNGERRDGTYLPIQLLDQLGQNGWELAAAERGYWAEWFKPKVWMLLKRPLP